LTLPVLYAFATLNQALKTASSVTILLTALSLHASPILVGTLTALAGLLPMLFAVSIGRLNDRFGARVPMIAGASLLVVSSCLPALWPGLPALFVTTVLTGVAAMSYSVSTQSVVGLIGRHQDRARNFSWLSMAFSGGGVLGPILAGAIIDGAGYAAAFTVIAFFPLPALAALLSRRIALPPSRAKGGEPRRSRAFASTLELLQDRRLRTVYLLTGLHVSAWEVFSFLVPVYGSGIGLSAGSIGFILGTFSAATFTVRMLMPFFARRFAALSLIRASLVLAGVLFIVFPLMSSVAMLACLAFILGTGLGVTQPLAMSVLHESAPEGRTGEAVGLRTAVVNLSSSTMPLVYGALGGALGMTPVFWGIAAAIWMSVWALR
jgi:MFS family permease